MKMLSVQTPFNYVNQFFKEVNESVGQLLKSLHYLENFENIRENFDVLILYV